MHQFHAGFSAIFSLSLLPFDPISSLSSSRANHYSPGTRYFVRRSKTSSLFGSINISSFHDRASSRGKLEGRVRIDREENREENYYRVGIEPTRSPISSIIPNGLPRIFIFTRETREGRAFGRSLRGSSIQWEGNLTNVRE